jgi:F-type H+-transporting ATPase subunit delta
LERLDPTQTAEQRRELINGVFTDINPYIKNMMYVLADNRHISLIADVFKAFQSLYNGHYNQDFATIESTYELSQEELDKIANTYIIFLMYGLMSVNTPLINSRRCSAV